MNSAPTSERIVQANGVDLCVETFGPTDAPPVLLIGGASTSMLYWEDEFCERLAASPRFVVRYDHRDTGRSVTYEPGSPGYTAGDLDADAVGVLDALGVERAHLVGLSMGGGIAQTIAVEHPDRVASLTLLSTSAVGKGPDLGLPSMSAATLAEFEAVAEPDWSDRDAVISYFVEQERLCAARSRPFDEAGMRAVMTRVVERAIDVRSSMNHFMIMGGDDGFDRARLGEITVPTVVLHGDEDPVFPPAHGAALAAAIPGARLVTLPHHGHELPRRSWDAVVAEILRVTAES